MANSRVITLDELKAQQPILRLRLEKTAKELQAKKQNDPGFIQQSKTWFKKMISHQIINIELEEGADEETTQRNKQKIKDLFNKLETKLNQQKESVLESMDGLTAEQQEGILTFWTESYYFLTNVLKLMRYIFNKVIEWIKEGYRLIKQAVTDFFSTIYDLIKKVF